MARGKYGGYEGEPKGWADHLACLPCQHGEHEACRHKMDGPRFTRDHPVGSCQCENRGHDIPWWRDTCEKWVSGDMGSGHRCGKKVKGQIEVRSTFIYLEGLRYQDHTFDVCGVHLSAHSRRAVNDARRRAEGEARSAERKRERENKHAAEDYCARLAAYGIKADPAEVDGRYTGAVAIQGETVMKIVEEVVMLRRELGIGEDEPIGALVL